MAGGRTLLDVAQELVAGLGLRFGEVTLQVIDGDVRLIRQGTVLKPQDLAQLPAPP